MATTNKSPSYLAERAWGRRKFLANNWASRYKRDLLRKATMTRELTQVMDDDEHTDWEALVEEHKHSHIIATNNVAARRAFELARASGGKMAAPGGISGMCRVASIPSWFVYRMMIEDPDFWKDWRNVLRVAQNFPEWSTVPQDIIRGELEGTLPKGRRIELVSDAACETTGIVIVESIGGTSDVDRGEVVVGGVVQAPERRHEARAIEQQVVVESAGDAGGHDAATPVADVPSVEPLSPELQVARGSDPAGS